MRMNTRTGERVSDGGRKIGRKGGKEARKKNMNTLI